MIGRRTVVVVVSALSVALLAAGCSSDDSSSSGTGAPASPEQFTGDVDDFYVVPDPLPPGSPAS